MATVAELQTEIEPTEAGFDPERLARIDRHLATYVDGGLLPGTLIAVTRGGRIVHLTTNGARDDVAAPVEPDTLWRIFSMTKPVTSIATMMLYEEGAFKLSDPISDYIPAFAEMRVYERGTALVPVTAPAREPIRIWHLLTHTSGLSYGFGDDAVDVLYRQAGVELLRWDDYDSAGLCERVAALPLQFEPGSEWGYSVATDVLGRLVEVVTGESLAEAFERRIFRPLGMSETHFHAREEDTHRLAALYTPDAETGRAVPAPDPDVRTRDPRFLSGGAGLVSTAADYHRFTQMLLRRGELDGARLIGPRTLDYMTRNHLPGGAQLDSFGRPLADMNMTGLGFGLGFATVEDPAANRILRSRGEFSWGGAANTHFWVDPAEEITVLFFAQVLFGPHQVWDELRQLVYQALVD